LLDKTGNPFFFKKLIFQKRLFSKKAFLKVMQNERKWRNNIGISEGRKGFASGAREPRTGKETA
jgi:hypothetical protein